MNTSKQVIILVDDKKEIHKLSSVDELNKFLKAENQARESLHMDLLGCENTQIFVGEERCLEVNKGRASTQYKLSAAGCGCKGEIK